ncbi:MAG: ethylbenzene dehydrogenase-related protein [Candidatus Zixiibacteriota bacterium]
MQKYILSLTALAALVVAGCSSKDSSPNGPNAPSAIRIVVSVPATAPSLTDVNSAVWTPVTPTAVAIQDTTPVKLSSIAGGNSLTDSVHVQALQLRDTLYLRITWHDATNDIWPGAWYVHDTLQHCNVDTSDHCASFVSQTDGIWEDRLIVLWGGLAGAQWDALDWRALTTGAGGLAEGGIYKLVTGHTPPDTLIPDAEDSPLEVAYPNSNLGFAPLFMHRDSSEYHGAILYLGDSNTVDFDIYSKGWAINQFLPAYYIDSSLAGKDPSVRGSRWDTRAANTWSSGTYTLVLAHPMHTTYADDVDLKALDSVQTQFAVFDNQLSFNRTSHRGVTLPFWLILQ